MLLPVIRNGTLDIFYTINTKRWKHRKTYLCLRKCKLNAKKANAKVTPTLARQVTARKAAGATVTTLNLTVRKISHLLLLECS